MALRDDDFRLRLVRIAPDALFAHLHFEDAEIAQLNIASIRQRLLDDIERLLHGINDLFLREARLPVDLQYYFSFGQVRHGVPF